MTKPYIKNPTDLIGINLPDLVLDVCKQIEAATHTPQQSRDLALELQLTRVILDTTIFYLTNLEETKH